MVEESFEYDALSNLNVDGDAFQYFDAGFETNPTNDDQNDWLYFQFDLEAPEAALKDGKIVYQYITYSKEDDYSSDPITIGCATKLGSYSDSRVDTFQGTNSMSSDSTVIVGQTWQNQNNQETAKVKDSFGLKGKG